jgi:hypothetical protein
MIPVIAQGLGLNIIELAIDNPHCDNQNDRKRELKDDEAFSDEDLTGRGPKLALEHKDGFEPGKIKGGIAPGDQPGAYRPGR